MTVDDERELIITSESVVREAKVMSEILVVLPYIWEGYLETSEAVSLDAVVVKVPVEEIVRLSHIPGIEFQSVSDKQIIWC